MTGAQEIERLFRGARGRFEQGLGKVLNRHGAIMARNAIKRAPVKSGQLRRSIQHVVEDSRSLRVGIVTPDKPLVYARIREFGGTITGKPTLCFPLPGVRGKIVTASGVGGVRARDVIANPQAYGYSSTFLSKSGRAIMGNPIGGGPPEPLFARVHSVTQKGTPYLIPSVEEEIPNLVQALDVLFDAGGSRA